MALRHRALFAVALLFFLAGIVAGTLVWKVGPRAGSAGGTIFAQPARAESSQAAKQPAPADPWLKGTPDEKFAQIERHLRGLDVAMVEIGYRYGELLYAAEVKNWDYAQYQAEKIGYALGLAIERRPKRAQSAKPFLESDLPRVLNAIKTKQPERLASALDSLHVSCIVCHKNEKVEHFSPIVDRIKQRATKSEPQAMLIEPQDLQKKLNQPGLRILDARGQADYAKGHIPGAVRVDVKSWQNQGKKEGGFHDAKAWGALVGELGIAHDSNVVVYGSNLTNTARIWWTLKYLGLKKVAILNGGWQLWEKENRPVDAAPPQVAATKFEPKFQADRLEEIDSLKKSVQAGKVTVVDARTEDEFTGKDVRGKRGGHIPGAKHLEWKELVAEDGRFKSPEQLRELFRQRGIHPEDTAVTC